MAFSVRVYFSQYLALNGENISRWSGKNRQTCYNIDHSGYSVVTGDNK